MEPPIIAVSDKAQLQVVCRLEEVVTDTGGTATGKRKRLVAMFSRGGAPDWVMNEAEKRFQFQGRADGEPLVQLVGVFDSAETAQQLKWSEDEHDAVVRHLREADNPLWFIAEEPRLEAPWPTYDALTIQGNRNWDKVAAQNLQTAELTGIPVETLVGYERQNRADTRILDAYKAAQAKVEEVEAEDLVEA